MLLYRPVGQAELALIEAAGWRAFPPRLPHQPIFYPVLSQPYAEEIAAKWNTRDENSQFRGYVVKFEVDDAYFSRFEVHTVGNHTHQELWVPAVELAEFNRHILGEIEVVARFESEA